MHMYECAAYFLSVMVMCLWVGVHVFVCECQPLQAINPAAQLRRLSGLLLKARPMNQAKVSEGALTCSLCSVAVWFQEGPRRQRLKAAPSPFSFMVRGKQ